MQKLGIEFRKTAKRIIVRQMNNEQLETEFWTSYNNIKREERLLKLLAFRDRHNIPRSLEHIILGVMHQKIQIAFRI